MIIKEIKIWNFRSIQKAEISLNEISMFVGMNDVGKSNVLKSLNLFFNGQTDYRTSFSFDEDYCKHTPPKNKKAKEIIIEIHINVPSTYTGIINKDGSRNQVIWKKIWRKNIGLYSESLVLSNDKSLPAKSRIIAWVRNIKYLYIPAIRDNLYFESLLSELHDSLADTIENELVSAGDSFIKKIESNTTSMIDEINNRLNLRSQIKLPPNLRSLFRTLDFSTNEGSHEISLTKRGDGIKTRYIPVILKFISEQYNYNRVKGSPVINTIWGYEEPENNLEIVASFNLAKDFLHYSTNTQILLSTHSPGFYTLESPNNNIHIFQVTKDQQLNININHINLGKELNEAMGVMPLIAPYVKEKIDEITYLKKNVEELDLLIKSVNKNVIFVEGKDEFRILSKIIEILKMPNDISISKELNGCSGVKDKLMAWSWLHGQKKYRAIGIFDNDISGNNEFSKLNDENKFINAVSNQKVKAFKYKPYEHLNKIKKSINLFPIELEELYPLEIWEYAEEKGWLEERNIEDLRNIIIVEDVNQSILQKIDNFGFDKNELIYVKKKFKDSSKEKISKYLVELENDTFKIKLSHFIDYFNENVFKFISPN